MTENSRQIAEDSPEAIARDQTVKEQEAGESETPLEAEKEKNTVTSGVHKNRDPETAGDRHAEPSNNVRWRKLKDGGQGAQPTAPVEIARSIAEKNYVGKTLALLSPPKYDQFTNIVTAYDVVIARNDLARLQIGTRLNDKNIDWMLRWWAGQVNGRFGKRPSPPQPNPQLPRCYFVSTFWYAKLTLGGVFSYDNVKRWTAQFDILQQYDLMLIPIHVPARDHWILAVIDLKNKKTMVYDSIEGDITRTTHPEIHEHLMAWLRQEHQARIIPFDVKEWEAIRGRQTPQQGYGKDVGVDCGVFVIAYAMYLSTNRPFELFVHHRDFVHLVQFYYGQSASRFSQDFFYWNLKSNLVQHCPRNSKKTPWREVRWKAAGKTMFHWTIAGFLCGDRQRRCFPVDC